MEWTSKQWWYSFSRALIVGACIILCITVQGCTGIAGPSTPTLQDLPLPSSAQQVTNSRRPGHGTTVDVITFRTQDNPDAVYDFFEAEMTRPDRGWNRSEHSQSETVFGFNDAQTGAAYFLVVTATATTNGDTEVELEFYHLGH
jgi:hypothetical protein